MAKTLESIQQQIQKLQEQANAIKRKEAVGVIARIKTAIEAYGLTPDDLFGDAAALPSKRAAKSADKATPQKAKRAPGKRASIAKKVPNPPKFTDGNRFWTGQGKRPQWFKDAIEAGKTLEELAVKAT